MKPAEFESLSVRAGVTVVLTVLSLFFSFSSFLMLIGRNEPERLPEEFEERVELKLTKCHKYGDDGTGYYSYMIGRCADGSLWRKQSHPIADEGEIISVRLSRGWTEQ